MPGDAGLRTRPARAAPHAAGLARVFRDEKAAASKRLCCSNHDSSTMRLASTRQISSLQCRCVATRSIAQDQDHLPLPAPHAAAEAVLLQARQPKCAQRTAPRARAARGASACEGDGPAVPTLGFSSENKDHRSAKKGPRQSLAGRRASAEGSPRRDVCKGVPQGRSRADSRLQSLMPGRCLCDPFITSCLADDCCPTRDANAERHDVGSAEVQEPSTAWTPQPCPYEMPYASSGLAGCQTRGAAGSAAEPALETNWGRNSVRRSRTKQDFDTDVPGFVHRSSVPWQRVHVCDWSFTLRRPPASALLPPRPQFSPPSSPCISSPLPSPDHIGSPDDTIRYDTTVVRAHEGCES